MNIIFSTLIAIIIILLFVILAAIFAAWLDGKDKDKFIEKIVDRVSSLIDSKLESVTEQREASPWYLEVHTQDSGYPIWISHDTIRSIHPDPENGKIIVKQFNGEDIVIDNVSSYEMFAANDLIGCGMKIDITHTT